MVTNPLFPLNPIQKFINEVNNKKTTPAPVMGPIAPAPKTTPPASSSSSSSSKGSSSPPPIMGPPAPQPKAPYVAPKASAPKLDFFQTPFDKLLGQQSSASKATTKSTPSNQSTGKIDLNKLLQGYTPKEGDYQTGPGQPIQSGGKTTFETFNKAQGIAAIAKAGAKDFDQGLANYDWHPDTKIIGYDPSTYHRDTKTGQVLLGAETNIQQGETERFAVSFPYAGAEKYGTYKARLDKDPLGAVLLGFGGGGLANVDIAYYRATGDEQKLTDTQIQRLYRTEQVGKQPWYEHLNPFGQGALGYYLGSPGGMIATIYVGSTAIGGTVGYLQAGGRATAAGFVAKGAALGGYSLLGLSAADVGMTAYKGDIGAALGKADILALGLAGAVPGYKQGYKFGGDFYNTRNPNKPDIINALVGEPTGGSRLTIQRGESIVEEGIPIKSEFITGEKTTYYKPGSRQQFINFPGGEGGKRMYTEDMFAPKLEGSIIAGGRSKGIVVETEGTSPVTETRGIFNMKGTSGEYRSVFGGRRITGTQKAGIMKRTGLFSDELGVIPEINGKIPEGYTATETRIIPPEPTYDLTLKTLDTIDQTSIWMKGSDEALGKLGLMQPQQKSAFGDFTIEMGPSSDIFFSSPRLTNLAPLISLGMSSEKTRSSLAFRSELSSELKDVGLIDYGTETVTKKSSRNDFVQFTTGKQDVGIDVVFDTGTKQKQDQWFNLEQEQKQATEEIFQSDFISEKIPMFSFKQPGFSLSGWDTESGDLISIFGRHRKYRTGDINKAIKDFNKMFK